MGKNIYSNSVDSEQPEHPFVYLSSCLTIREPLWVNLHHLPRKGGEVKEELIEKSRGGWRKSEWQHRKTTFHIWPNYHTYPYKLTIKQFRSLQITVSVLSVYFFIKAYVVGTHLICIDLLMLIKWVPTTYAFIMKIRKTTKKKTLHQHHLISPALIFF